MEAKKRVYHDDVEQGSDEWLYLRLGVITGSDFKTAMSKGVKTVESYARKKASEIVYEDSDDSDYKSPAMVRGSILEYEARMLYSAVNEVDVKETGFVTLNSLIGCSPDGLVGEDGIIEIKCLINHVFFGLVIDSDSLDKMKVDPKYEMQIQYNLYVTGRKWCDYVVYHPRAPLSITRIYRDEKLIAKIEERLDYLVNRIKELICEYYLKTSSKT